MDLTDDSALFFWNNTAINLYSSAKRHSTFRFFSRSSMGGYPLSHISFVIGDANEYSFPCHESRHGYVRVSYAS
jgi:hypothetical protein